MASGESVRDASARIGVAANQVEVNTNQIEIQRTQYANGLNQLVDAIGSNVVTIAQICGKSPAQPLVAPCDSTKGTANEFKTVYERGKKTFTLYKAQIQAELAKQEALIRQIDN